MNLPVEENVFQAEKILKKRHRKVSRFVFSRLCWELLIMMLPQPH